jgi:NADH-quinone oxidoreductase subunit N
MILAPSQTLNIQALGSAEWIGGAPLLCVAAGILLAICAEIVPGLRPARGLAYVGSLLAALFFELRLVAEPRGVIFQGAFSADATAALWGALFTFAGLLAWLYGRRYYKEEKPHTAEHDILMLCSVLGMMLMAGAEDLLTFFVGLELLSVPLYALAGFRRIQNRSVEAGLRYFLLGAFAAGLFLYGAALIYIATGTISLAGLREVGLPSRLAVVGAALVASSLFFKVSVFPFHFWVPDVYQGSPTPVTTFMATGTKAAGFAFLLKIAFLLPPGAAGTLAAISLVTMAIGNLGALIQTDLKRLLAYSAVAHAGTLLLVVTSSLVGDPRADGPLQAALYYMAAYVFTAAGAFGIVALLEGDGEHFTQLDALRGLGRRRPGLAAALSIFMLSLGGFPATGGFFGKYFVFASTLRADMWVASVVGVLLSVIALAYYLRVILTLWMKPEPEGQAPPRAYRPSASFATGVCVFLVFALGLAPGWFLERFF